MKRAWSVELSSEFATGAGVQLRNPEPGVVTFLAPWDSSPQPMWFHFRIRGAKGWKVRFVLLNANRCLGGEKDYAGLRVRPVITEDPPNLKPSQRRWRRIPKEDLAYDSNSGRFTFTVQVRSNEAYVAHCYPYGLAEWREFLDDFKRNRCLKTGTIGTTANGRPIPQAWLTEGNDIRKKVIWFTARHHSGETPGSWALEGTLRWLLSADRRAEELRKQYLFRVVPFADLDGVEEGFYGKERAPLDFNRAYLEDTPRPDVAHIFRAVLAMGRRNLAFFDNHAPGAGGAHQIFLKGRGGWQRDLCMEYGKTLAAMSPRGSRLDPKNLEVALYQGDEAETTSTDGMHLATGILTVTHEVSYALTSDDHVLTRKEYLAYGAAMGKALHRLVSSHRAEIETTGWGEKEEESVPFPEYGGKAFRGGFGWSPPRDASLAATEDRMGEILEMGLQKESSCVHLACPRVKVGGKKRLDLAWRSAAEGTAAIRAQVTIFYYGRTGLRFRRDEKLALDSTGGQWQRLALLLDPPRGATRLRVSLRVTGGPGSFSLRAPCAT